MAGRENGSEVDTEQQIRIEDQYNKQKEKSAHIPLEFKSIEACITTYDEDRDGSFNEHEFSLMCRALFRNYMNEPYELKEDFVPEIFSIFDQDKDGFLNSKELEYCWSKWVHKILHPVNALVVVDVQNDFISGSLAVSNCPAKHNGEEVIEPINQLLDSVEFDCVFYTLDWHPADHVSFVDNVKLRKFHSTSKIQNQDEVQVYDTVVFEGPPVMEQKLWPRHCVQNSWGAKLHENLKIVEGSPFIYKGTNPEVDSYSAFFDNFKLSKTTLRSEMEKAGVTDVYVCGLAYDVCVGATACHSAELGYRTILIDDGCRGISEEDIESTKRNLEDIHSVVVHSTKVSNMVGGLDRRPELAFKLALENKSRMEEN